MVNKLLVIENYVLLFGWATGGSWPGSPKGRAGPCSPEPSFLPCSQPPPRPWLMLGRNQWWSPGWVGDKVHPLPPSYVQHGNHGKPPRSYRGGCNRGTPYINNPPRLSSEQQGRTTTKEIASVVLIGRFHGSRHFNLGSAQRTNEQIAGWHGGPRNHHDQPRLKQVTLPSRRNHLPSHPSSKIIKNH